MKSGFLSKYKLLSIDANSLNLFVCFRTAWEYSMDILSARKICKSKSTYFPERRIRNTNLERHLISSPMIHSQKNMINLTISVAYFFKA